METDNKFFLRQSGLTLLELAIGLSLSSVFLFAFMRGMDTLRSRNQKTELLQHISDIKSRIIGSLDCKKTFESFTSRPPCTGSGTYIDLISGPSATSPSGRTLVSSAGTKIGPMTVRALCTSVGIDVRAAFILPNYQNQISTLMDWRSLSSPAQPERYKSDVSYGQSTSNKLHWNHPVARIFRPGSMGLCSEYFSATLPSSGCPAGSLIKSVNFDTNAVTCLTIPSCNPPQRIHWNGNSFICSSDLQTRIANEFATYFTATVPDYSTMISNTANNFNTAVTNTENRFGGILNPANDYVIMKFTDAECRTLATMSCQTGFVTTRYEFRYDTASSQKCSMSCSKLSP